MKGLPKQVKTCLNKALDSALLAVETYNKPAVKFKSGGYIVLMCIAWTALLHAIFCRNKIKPMYKEKNGRFKKVDGEVVFWELKTCVSKYFLNTNDPIRKNLEFFIPLRNKIEHKFLPELDANIFAECQSMLLNFDKIVQKEFGTRYCLRESLSFALQLFPSTETLRSATKSNKEYDGIMSFINKYRSSISTDIMNSGEYAFKAFLIQVANHKSKDALPIQFFPYDKMTDEEKKIVERVAAMIKEKHIPVANDDKMKPSTVVNLVQTALGNKTIIKGKKKIDKFNITTHTLCWKKYKVRPDNNNLHPELTDSRYCVYDSMNKNYGFTQAWVDFLIEKMSDENEYNSLYFTGETKMIDQ